MRKSKRSSKVKQAGSRRAPGSRAPRTSKPVRRASPSDEESGDRRFKELAELLSAAIFETDTAGRITYANQKAFECFGYNRQDFRRGVNLRDTLAPADHERALKVIEEIYRGRLSNGHEYLARRKDGSAFPIVAYASAMYRGGRIVGLRGVIFDITERKRAEEELRDSEEKFRSIIENSTNIFYIHTPDHVFTYVSPQVEEILGYRQDETFRRWTDAASDDPVNARAIEITGRAIATGLRQPPYEVELLAKDGRRVWLEIHEAPVVRDGRTVAIVGAAQDVTERKRARDDHQKLVSIVRSSSELVNLATLDGKMVFLNEAGADMLGIEPDDVENHTILEVIPAEYRELVRTELVPCLLNGGTWEGDLRYRNVRTGTLTDVHALTFTIPDSRTGAPLYLANVSRDITERKRAEEALREREAQLGSIFRASPIGIGVVSKGSRILIEVNDRICEMTGYAREELVGNSARMLYATDQEYDFVGVEKYRQMAEQGVGSVETLWRRKDGTMIDVLLNSAPLAAGNEDSGVTFTALDVTERRRSEGALRESEKKYRELIEMLQEGIWVIDRGGLTTFVNPRMAEILGYAPGEMLGRHLFSFMDEVGVDECKRLLERRRQGISEQHDFEFLRKDGERVYARVETAPVVDENGCYAGAIAGVQDNTERRRAEDERRRLELQVQQAQKLESLGVLAGGIAHDFNNLLQAIHGNLEFAMSSLPSDSPAQEHLIDLERASRRAAELCGQLLAYSGRGRLTVGALDLGTVIQEMVQILDVSISKKAELRLNLAPDLPLIEADEAQIRQVVMNLIVNASEALGDGSGVIIIATHALDCQCRHLRSMILGEGLPEGRYVCLEVADTGCGMDEETQRRIFDPFFTTKFTGRGLGLAAVLGIVRGHGGAIKIRSKKGEGTTFRILFPVSTSGAERIESAPAEIADVRGGGTVLFADDEEMVRSVAKRMLEHLGYTVLLAADGNEAIEVFQAHRNSIACVILDLTMPRKDGIETLAELRRIDGDVPAILTSGYSKYEISSRYADEGFAEFIEKPYHMTTLGAKIKSVLRAKVHGGIEG
jgi:two-component system cell cycle sensor histidine kinase/response regulator CckA